MSLKENKIVWKKGIELPYTTLGEIRKLVSVIVPLTKKEYQYVFDNFNNDNIELFKDKHGFLPVSIPRQQIAMLSTRDAFFNDITDAEDELQDIIPEIVYGHWIYTHYDHKLNIIGYRDDIAKITQTFSRSDVFIEAYGIIGNPKYFIIIRVKREHINRLTKDGIKRIEHKLKKEEVCR